MVVTGFFVLWIGVVIVNICSFSIGIVHIYASANEIGMCSGSDTHTEIVLL